MVHEQLDLFEDEGARLDRVVIGHLDVHPHLKSLRNVYQEVLDRGAYVQFDTVGKEGFFELELDPEYGQKFPYDPERAEMIAELVQDGYVERILISCDIDTLSLTSRAWRWGVRSLGDVRPRPPAAGLTKAQIRTITMDNPARVLAMVAPA